MIKLQGKLPRSVYVGCSGGADSMAVVDFLSRSHDVEVIFYHHGSEHDNAAQQMVYDYCHKKNIECILGGMNKDDTIKPGMSKEDFWRWKRYRFFEQFARPETPVITCHHLDDCAETWIWSSLNGNPSIIPYRRNNVIRPFRLNRKKDLELWAQLQGVPYINDPTNADTVFTRNYIRHELMPHALRVNPGLHKVIKKKVLQDVQDF
jgi:tRNA(Ile)-lysidine synthase